MVELAATPLPRAAHVLFWAIFGLGEVIFLTTLLVVWGGPFWSFVFYLVTWAGCTLLLGRVGLLMHRPFRYRVESGVLAVPGHFGPVYVGLPGARVSTGPITGVRLSGTAIPPFCLGLFADRDGRYHAAATAREGVWVRGERRVFLTPADRPGFLAAARAAGAIVD